MWIEPSFCQYHIIHLIICNTFMALYAVDDADLIHAGHAEPGKVYWCLDCFGPVKKRRGKKPFPHFYHLKPSPQCRLYSKTENHLLAQIQLQKFFPEGVLQIERPFIEIGRVADICWEQEKIVFEVQCSSLTEKEAEMRISDYRSTGYEVVWLLDDKRYNRRVARPGEEYLRRHSAYYLSIQRGLNSKYYDQFEIFARGLRVKKGNPMPVDFRKIRLMPRKTFPENLFPKQIIQLSCIKYFHGDRLHRALQNHILTMQNWRALEIHFAKTTPSKLKQWLRRHIFAPYLAFLEKLIRQAR